LTKVTYFRLEQVNKVNTRPHMRPPYAAPYAPARMRVKRLLYFWFLFTVIVWSASQEALGLSVGFTAPEFSADDLYGRPLKLSDHRGKWIFLDFWATWCGPCRSETPHLMDAYRQYHGHPIEFVSVSLDNDKEELIRYTQELGLPFRQIFSGKGWNDPISRLYGVRAIPENFLIDPTGRILAMSLRGGALQEKLRDIFSSAKPVKRSQPELEIPPSGALEVLDRERALLKGDLQVSASREVDERGMLTVEDRQIQLPGGAFISNPGPELPESEQEFLARSQLTEMPPSPFGGIWVYIKTPHQPTFTLHAFDAEGALRFSYHVSPISKPVWYDRVEGDLVLGSARDNLLWTPPWEQPGLGVVIARALRKQTNSDVGLYPALAIRGNIPKGDVRRSHLEDAIVGSDSVVVLFMKGTILTNLLSQAHSNENWVHVSGASVESREMGPGMPLMTTRLEDGTMAGLSKSYTVAAPACMAATIKAATVKWVGSNVVETVSNYVSSVRQIP